MSGFTLHLLRHGALEQPGLMMGRTDGASTAAGIAACVAQTAGLGVEQLISSDLQRASKAGAAISDALGLLTSGDTQVGHSQQHRLVIVLFVGRIWVRR